MGNQRALGNRRMRDKLALKSWVFPGTVPEVKNLHEVRGFIYAVVDQDWGMHELANAGTPGYRTADVGKGSEEIHVVQDGATEPFSGRWEVVPRITEDFLKVF
jgi:hypothetical protein